MLGALAWRGGEEGPGGRDIVVGHKKPEALEFSFKAMECLGLPAIGALSNPVFGWEASPKIDYRKKYNILMLTSLLEDLV